VGETGLSRHLCDGHLICELLSANVDTLLSVVDSVLRANLQHDIVIGWNTAVVNKSIKVYGNLVVWIDFRRLVSIPSKCPRLCRIEAHLGGIRSVRSLVVRTEGTREHHNM
jgi:hypothetical protein